MNVSKDDMILYAVTDRTWLNGETLEKQVEKAIVGGATFVQLREKECSRKEFLELAEKIKKVTEQYNVPFVINDDVEIAIACNADGVHIGQSDMELKAARKKLGDKKIIGVSAKTVEQAKEAQINGADYLGVGAVFPTSTKKDANCISIDTIREICQNVTIPVVAIGGIQKDNVLNLKGIGVDGIAVISGIFASENVKEATRTLRQLSQQLVKK